MADELVPPAVVPDPNAPPPPAAATAPSDGGTPPPPPVADPPPAQAIPQPIFDRIDRLTRDKKTAEESAAALRAENERLKAAAAIPPGGTLPAPVPAPAAAMPLEEIERRATALAHEREFANKCNNIAEAGEAAHQDFPMKIQQLAALQIISPELINAAGEIGEPHEILYALAADLTEATRIAALPPEQKGIALVRFDAKRKAKATEAISKLPAPPDVQVGGASPLDSSEPSPKDKAEDWFKKREKQIGISSGNYV